MNVPCPTGRYLKLYREISSTDPTQITNSELNRFAKSLGVEGVTDIVDEIFNFLTEHARRKYLYYWSLELDSKTVAFEDLQFLAVSLNVEELTGNVDEIVTSLQKTAKNLIEQTDLMSCSTPTQIKQEPTEINEIFV